MLVAFASVAIFSAFSVLPASSAAAGGACPNEGFRTGYSATLPDCRAYEPVSAPNVQPFYETFGSIQNVGLGTAVIGGELGTVASQESTTSRIAFFSTFAPPGSTTDGPYYLSSRGPQGWETRNLIPPQSTEVNGACLPYMIAWSTDLERGILADGFTSFADNCGADEPELVSGEPRGAQNLFLRDSATGTYQLIDQRPVSGSPATALYQASSADLGTVVFSEAAKLTPEAPTGIDYYVWAGGTVDRLLTVLPDGKPTVGEIADATVSVPHPSSATFSRAVAPDGTRVAFTADGNLYMRLNPGAPQSAFGAPEECDEPSKACTVQLDASETDGAGGGGSFMGTSGSEGQIVYFLDVNRLTSDSTASVGEPDLYQYDFREPAGSRLIDLSVDHNSGEHADVLGYVGSNETGPAGNYVYFVATGVLANNSNSGGASATQGAPNLYLAHDGATTFIATLSAATDSCDWENICMTSRVASRGEYLGFNSLEQLTGVSNVDANTGEPDQDIFVYGAGTGRLECASCGTTGTPPTSPASIRLPEGVYAFTSTPLYLKRNVSDAGQVFFDTQSQLVSSARNGLSNVYEFERGHLRLLSTGTAESPSYLYDASADGGDVYLLSAQALWPGGDPAELTLYDAKIDGGFPAPLTTPEPCSGDACSGPQAPLTAPPANASEAFASPGNVHGTASDARVQITRVAVVDGRRKVLARVHVSGAGQLDVGLVEGHGLSRRVSKAGSYTVVLAVSKRQVVRLRHHRQLTVVVTFHATDGNTASATRKIHAQQIGSR